MSDREIGSLHDLLTSKPNIVDFLYNDTSGPHGRTRGGLTPVPAEFSNWREEQQAWRETAVLFDQSHHMPELWVEGPDAFRLLNFIGVNSLANLRPGRAKQFVACNQHGMLIGDCILHDLGNQRYELISGMPLLNWVEYQALKGGYDVTIERESPTSPTSKQRTNFRFGMDGPNAGSIFAAVVEGEVPALPFFNTAMVKIAGCDVLALRHGMAGHKGVEMSGRYEDGPKVRAALLAAGRDFGLKLGGMKSYYSSVNESGWIGYPLPAIYTGDELIDYRKWLPADSWEAQFQIAGSFYSDNIEDYYLTPYDLGYGRIVSFDHDFIGKEALQAMADKPHLTKVTLAWNAEDVGKILASLTDKNELPYRYLEMPVSDYGLPQRDRVQTPEGELIGYSTLGGYSANEREYLSLAMIDAKFAEPGTEVRLIWGEPNGGSRKAQVERHRQLELRATVGPVPFAKFAQQTKRAALR